jgi:glutathione synthase/RimK-type ligase-like ATP-grasp enzyme
LANNERSAGGPSSRLLDAIVKLRMSGARTRIPRSLRSLGYRLLPQREFERKTQEAGYRRIVGDARRVPPRTSVTLGIIKDFAYKYGNYEAACLEMGVPYKLVSVTSPDWMREIRESGCDAFLVWPAHINSVAKKVFDERLRVLTEDMGKILFPDYKALWLYESKVRINDWLTVHDIPHPRTWVFWNRDEAMSFIEQAELPLVFKTDLGSTASGVEIVRTRKRARQLVSTCFGKGYLPRRQDPRDRAWGAILFQQYIPDAKEWRMVIIGDSYFGQQKMRRGEFHSGTRLVGWYAPPFELLDFCRNVIDKGSFLSTGLDVFETLDGRYLVNELHAVFGTTTLEEGRQGLQSVPFTDDQKRRILAYTTPYEMLVDGRAGRYVRTPDGQPWRFEEGLFCRNACCNLRVAMVTALLGSPLNPAAVEDEMAAPADEAAGGDLKSPADADGTV